MTNRNAGDSKDRLAFDEGWLVFGVTVIAVIFLVVLVGILASLFFGESIKRRVAQSEGASQGSAKATQSWEHGIIKGFTPTPVRTTTPTPILYPTQTPTLTPSSTVTPSPTHIPVFSWRTEVLQPSLAVGAFSSLVIDNDGFLHVVYFQDNNDVVWYAHDDHGKWLFDYVQGQVGQGFHLSLSLDQDGNPHIAYNNVKTKKRSAYLWYRSLLETGWSGPFRENTSPLTNTDVSLSLSQDGTAHFSYQAWDDFSLMYAQFNRTTGFDSQKVDYASDGCQSFPIAVDHDGGVHLCYCSQNGLSYAVLNEQEWQIMVVDPSESAGVFSEIALDDLGNPHIAYYDSGAGVLRYARLVGDSWEISLVDQNGHVGQYPSIAIDSQGNAHISYYDVQNSALKYALQNGSQWIVETIDNSGDVGMFNSIGLDPFSGEPRISYFDAGQEDLKIAWAARRDQ